MGRKETEEAIEESRRGGLKRFATVAELLADLNADDDQVTPFDPAEHLTSAEAVAEFLAEAEATADPAYIEHAHQVAARARTMHGLEGFLLQRDHPDQVALIELCRQNLSAGYARLDPALPADRLATAWRVWVPATEFRQAQP